MTADWVGWLDGLADVAARLEQQLQAGVPLDLPDLAPPPLGPDSPGLPREHLRRATELLDRLERLERIAQTQRDALGAQLIALAAPRPRPAAVPSYELGAAFDVAG